MALTAKSTVLVSKFTIFEGTGYFESSSSNFYSVNLDRSGAEETFFTCRHGAHLPWQNSYMHVFQFKSGRWSDVTTTVMPDNKIPGTEGIEFGDFNGDGKVDLYSATYTDFNYFLPSYVFDNTGTTLVPSIVDGGDHWQHGTFAYDINKDGYCDILVTDYPSDNHSQNSGIFFGGKNGLTFFSSEGRGLPWGASGICAADFLGNGTVTFIVTDGVGYYDATGQAGPDTRLLSYSIDNGKLSFVQISELPASRFSLPKWSNYNFTSPTSHDVRAIPFDFNRDGLLDVLIMSRPNYTRGEWPEYSEIQFLKNKGAGQFEDVTDSVLVGHNSHTCTSYNSQILDFNGDGLLDIFVTDSDYTTYDSTALLIQQSDGTFVEMGREFFNDIWLESLTATTKSVSGYVFKEHGKPMHLVKGDDGIWYVFTNVDYTENNGAVTKTAVYTTAISYDNFSSTSTQIIGTSAANKLTGTGGADLIQGLASNDTLVGLAGDDMLDGGAGNDSMVGGQDDDTYYVDSTGDKVTELANQGTDIVKTSLISYALGSNVENLIYTGQTAFKGIGNTLNNKIVGSLGADTLTGLAGDDTIQGIGGSDLISGGLGNDLLTGGAAADYFVFDTAPSNSNTDIITDFEVGLDKIRLSKSTFKISSSLKFSDQFVVGTQALDKYDRIIYDSAANKLYYDADGTGKIAPVQFAEVSTVGVTKLTSTDFVLF